MNPQDLERVAPYVYEIPKSHRYDMRVPARFYADSELLEMALEDKSLEQLVNSTTLPGIVKYALAMPDIHQGYGFPIGGVVATDAAEGVISPGGVGYDINCLHGESRILHELGYTLPIAHMETTWHKSSIFCENLPEGRADSAEIVRYLQQSPTAPVYQVTTEGGDEIIATADHPFWTPDGMVAVGRLQAGDLLALMPFIGVPYEAPDDTIIVDENDIVVMLQRLGKAAGGNTIPQVLNQLKRRGLLPLRANSPQFPYLLQLLGFLFGDGTIYFAGQCGKGIAWFYGLADDLETIRQTITLTGFTPSRIYSRQRHHRITTTYDTYEFEHDETTIKISSTAFAVLAAVLGVPIGNKVNQDFVVPGWLFNLPRWQQRLFLAALFGAELTTPRAFVEQNYNFYPPILAINKREGFIESGRVFLQGIADLLTEFNIETKTISCRTEQTNLDSTVSYRLRLILSSRPENLINLWSKVGFRFQRKRQTQALLAIQYLKRKQRLIDCRNGIAQQALTMRAEGASVASVVAQLADEWVNERFLERSIYEGRKTSARVAATFESFESYCRWAAAGPDMVWDRIATIELVDQNEVGHVYDFTVDHADHNFVANSFVVSNCGVRLLGTHLHRDEVAAHMDGLATQLQRSCPHGVGRSGEFKLKRQELEEIALNGSRWALEHGYATKMDLDRTEENGRIAGADPSKISARAYERVTDQLGTLGAGNHFIEVDVVNEIFDETAASRMGLFPGQIVVQIHCGSRGFGHQVCSDYVKRFQQVIHKYGIQLPDRELVCAPINSPEGQDYLGAMKGAANFAFANRQMLTYLIRRAFKDALGGKVKNHTVYQVYDIAHNMAKIEQHDVDGRQMDVCVHRKGATRAFGPGSAVLPDVYRDIGQPVLVPGSMGTASWVLLGTEGSMAQSFGSTCHGAGRTMSRSRAKKEVQGGELRRQLEEQGIRVRAGSVKGLAEEAPIAYKDVDRVIEVVHGAGIARKVARLVPVAVVKG